MIPEAAVEAAAEAIVAMRRNGHENTQQEYARAALEAAAPHMLARAWNEGYDYHRGITPDGLTGNPYRSAHGND